MSILKFVFEEKHIKSKPIGSVVTHTSGKTFVKESTGWYNVKTGKKLDYKSSLILEAGNNRYGISFDEKPDGYYMNGMKLTPEQAAPFVNYERMGDNWYNKKSGSAINHEDARTLDQTAAKLVQQLYKEHDDQEAANNSGQDEESDSESNKDEEVNTDSSSEKSNSESNKDQEVNANSSTKVNNRPFGITFDEKPDGYYMNGMKLTPEQAAPFVNFERMGDNWYNKKSGSVINHVDARALDQKSAKIVQQLYKEHDDQEAANNSSTQEDSTAPENNNAAQGQSEETPNAEDSQSSGEPESKPQDTSNSDPKPQDTSNSDPKPQDSGTGEAVNSPIPNGYVYTSGKGNKFIFKNGTWFNLATKKAVNQSNVNMLNRSAAKTIEDYNSKNEIKIGSTVTSNKGVEYTFNGTTFVSPDGKMLSGGAAKSAMNKIKAQNSSGTSDSSTSGTSDTQPSDNSSEDSTIVPGESAVDAEDTDSNAPAPNSPTPSTDSTSGADENGKDYNAQSIINNLGDQESGAESGSTDNSTDNSTGTPPTDSSSNNSSDDPLTKIAKQIKGNKYNKQIVTLLSRGSDIDVLAADILLNGNIQEVISQLKSLNNSNTQ